MGQQLINNKSWKKLLGFQRIKIRTTMKIQLSEDLHAARKNDTLTFKTDIQPWTLDYKR